MKLTDPVSTIKGIGPKKEKALAATGINTLQDIIYFFPRSYEDRRNVTPIAEADTGTEVLVEAEVVSLRVSGSPYNRKAPLSVLIRDESEGAEAVFFNGRFLRSMFRVGSKYVFFGKVSCSFGRKQMIHPQFSEAGSKDDIRGILPVYPAIHGISQNELRRIQRELAELHDKIPEWLPEDVIRDNRLCGPEYAVRNIHFPQNAHRVLASRFRMVFEELITLQTGLMYIRSDKRLNNSGVVIDTSYGDSFVESLPFSLTDGQRGAWSDIKSDLNSTKRMNRLLQGDVGSGKTVIAEMSMYSAAGSGYQSVIMAPTELLAKQHADTFSKDLSESGFNIVLLVSSMPAASKKSALRAIESGEADMVIATHAVIQENVIFHDLGLVITDEQHRFGVEQRRTLSSKGENANILVMTATPIPRTLAVILYGDLDVSQIKSMPAGRKPVQTSAFGQDDRKRVYGFAKKEIAKGRQGYVVAPLIEDSESVDAVSAESLYKELRKEFNGYKLALVHGSIKPADKEQIMADFAAGLINILVSTVVIEVGINVKNATFMIIENAERFGLAQLHQLRGRVGRGSSESYCFLITNRGSELAAERADILCTTNDGFEIAEKDLELRGPGEIFGTRQHGLPNLILSDIVKHQDVLRKAAASAKKIIQKDPELSSPQESELKRRVKKMFGEDIKLDL